MGKKKEKEKNESVTAGQDKGILEKAWDHVTGSVKHAGKNILKTSAVVAGIYGTERLVEHIYEDKTGFDIQWNKPVSGKPIVTGVDTHAVLSEQTPGRQASLEREQARLDRMGSVLGDNVFAYDENTEEEILP